MSSSTSTSTLPSGLAVLTTFPDVLFIPEIVSAHLSPGEGRGCCSGAQRGLCCRCLRVTPVPKLTAQDPRQLPEPRGAGGSSSSEKSTGCEAANLSLGCSGIFRAAFGKHRNFLLKTRLGCRWV